MPLTAPVPREYAQRFDQPGKAKESTYGANQVSTGPYMLERDARGTVTGYREGHFLRLVRNPNWNTTDPDRPAYADRIDIDIHYQAIAPAARKVLSGANTFSVGTGADLRTLRRLLRARSPQLAISSVPGYQFVSLKTTVKPLDNTNVRRAIAAALDRRELLRLQGGPRLATIATHYLPPGFPGYTQAGGARPFVDFLAHPAGDAALAHRYMRRAGYADGRYHGSARLVIVTIRDPESRAFDAVLRRAFAIVGIPVRLRVFSPAASNAECARRAARIAVCDSGWFADFPDPQTMLQPVFDGRAIIPTGSPNLSFIDNRQINAAIDRAKQAVGAADRARAWATVDRLVTTLVPYIPTYWPKAALIRGSAVDGQISQLNGEWHLPSLGLRR
jgi:peptide/nickel transport system substrate-binding protein